MTQTEKSLLVLLNRFLKTNSKARKYQTEFENALAEFNGIEREDLSMLMETYIDMDIIGDPHATLKEMKQIIMESTKPWD
jgi:hypothetical protein